MQQFFATKMLQKLVFATLAIVAKNVLNHIFSRVRTALGILRQSCNAETSTKTYLQQQDQFSISLSLRVSKENATLQIGCENQGYNAVLVGIIFFFLLKS